MGRRLLEGRRQWSGFDCSGVAGQMKTMLTSTPTLLASGPERPFCLKATHGTAPTPLPRIGRFASSLGLIQPLPLANNKMLPREGPAFQGQMWQDYHFRPSSLAQALVNHSRKQEARWPESQL